MEEMSRQLASLSLSNSTKKPSWEVVISNEDLLFEILLHVPARSLICLKLVSKQWRSVITSNNFSIRHRRRRRTTAIFLQSDPFNRRGYDHHMIYVHLDLDCDNKNKNHKESSKDNNPFRTSTFSHDPRRVSILQSCHDLLLLDCDNENKNHKEFSKDNNPFRTSTFSHDPFDPSRVCILQSCHGLLLCRTGIAVDIVNQHRGLFNYYVYNPTTNKVATIERVWDSKIRIYASVLHYDPAKSPHYKVVFCLGTSPELNNKQRLFEVYMSETGTWKVTNSIPDSNLGSHNFAYFKGCIYWISRFKVVNTMFYYDVDEERLATLPRPPWRNSWRNSRMRNMRRHLYFGESAGHLHLAEVLLSATTLDLYELNCDRSGWFLKYNVDLTRLAKDFPEMSNNKYALHDEYAFNVLSMVRRREDFDEDSVLVLEIPGKVIVYNLVDQSWKEVWKFCGANNAQRWFCGLYRAMDCIESLACVTSSR